jgi:predicted DNA-binding protein (UPF0251 family)
MLSIKEKYIVNEKGKRIGVMLDLKEYKKVLMKLEELESIRAYDLAKASKERPIPFAKAVKEIEKGHK